jgi:AcrR family transcriptional regulator
MGETKERRRLAILRAAAAVFARKGYHLATVEDIARAARVAKGTVYLYFPDKRSIFAEIIDHLFVRMSAAILRVDTAADVEAQVKHNIRATLSVLVDDPDTMRMLFAHATGLDRAFTAKIESFYVGLKRKLVDSLEDGQALGIVTRGDARLFASFTIGALKEILVDEAERAQNRRSREEIVEALYALLQSGYLRVAPKGEPPKRPRAARS